MSWSVTVEVSDCSSPATHIAGATIKMTGVALGTTDGSGRYTATLDDYQTPAIFEVSVVGSHYYVAANLEVNKDTDQGQVKQVCLQHPDTIPDGVDPNVGGQSGGSNPSGGCFIVTATTGSPESVEVNRLRELRDRVSTASQVGAQLIDTIYGEYAQFSPRVAAELEHDEASREAVLQLVVRPLLAWYTLAGTLGLEDANRETISQAVRDVVNACPRYMGRPVVTMLEALRSGEALPDSAPPLVLDLVPRVAHLPYASWAILDPLIRAWRSATDNLDVVEEVAQWLASAPLESLAPASDPKQLDRELAVLADFLDFRPMARRQLGERLSTTWPDAAGALEHAGFVS
jgi:hypothetical protein